MPLPISITDGQAGHISNHEQLDQFVNDTGGDGTKVVRTDATQTITGTKSFAKAYTKFNPVNVMHPDYGAKGDGTTNDSTAIQAAIDAAIAAGDEVFFPAGTYRANGLTWASTTPCRMRGAGMNKTTIRSNGTGAILTLGNVAALFMGGTNIEDIFFDGANTAAYGIYANDQVVQNTFTRVRIENCLGTPGIGLYAPDRFYSTTMHACQLINNIINLDMEVRAQNFCAVASRFYHTGTPAQPRTNVKIGNGTQQISDIKFLGCDIEYGGATGQPITNFLLRGVNLVVRDAYMEAGGHASSNDFTITADSSFYTILELSGTRCKGNSSATNCIILPNDTTTYAHVYGENVKISGYLGQQVTNFRNTRKCVRLNTNMGASNYQGATATITDSLAVLTSADQNFTDATLTDITGLSMPVEENATYILEGFIMYDSTTTNDIKINVGIPAGSNFWVGQAAGFSGVTGGTGSGTWFVSANAVLTPGGARAAGGARSRVATRIYGTVITSTTPGQVKLSAAKNANTDTTTPGDDALVYANSWLTLRRIA